jgi:small subunit ribosomal protein S16
MPVKIRLQRRGKKGKPYFHIVAADVRAKRDGRYIERLGSYNPTTNPATIELDGDAALRWLQNGAVPTDTARAILSYRGVLYRNHLLRGVRKGAMTEAEADKKYEQWLAEKEQKIEKRKETLGATEAKEAADRLAKEREIKEARAQELAAANAPEVEETEEEAPAEAPTEEASTEEPKAEEKKEEPKAEEKKEAPKAEEKKEEPKAEEKKEEPKAEEKKEEPKAEEKKEEPKAEAEEDKKEDK